MTSKDLKLRDMHIDDLSILFNFQQDEEANQIAAFTSKDPRDKDAFIEKWKKLLDDTTINAKTIWLKDEIVGSITKYEIEEKSEITYWIGRDYWGKGVASQALRLFLIEEKVRPIYARVAYDNMGSTRVLEKCGFIKCGESLGYANARGKDIAEYHYILE